MATFQVELRGATPALGGDRIDGITKVEAESWYHAREFVARRFGLHVYDPHMSAVEVPSPTRRRARARGTR